MNKIRPPSADMSLEKTSNAPLPPEEPVEMRVVVPPARSYRSVALSVSPATSAARVWIKTRTPSCEVSSMRAP
jgi:hypothetical protein